MLMILHTEAKNSFQLPLALTEYILISAGRVHGVRKALLLVMRVR